jgi:biotin operon repressor
MTDRRLGSPTPGGADHAPRRPPRTALALVLDELDNLPVVDGRHRLWPWSLRALARRRGTSPGTVHKHVQALRDAGVLVEDESQPSRTFVDIARLEDQARPKVAQPAGSPSEPVVAASNAGDHLVRAIDSLSTVAEARPELVDNLAEIIGRLAQLLAKLEPSQYATARGRAPQMRDEARDRAPSSEDRKRDDSSRSTPISLSPHRARRAPFGRAREARGEPNGRTPAQLFELLAPLDPARHVTYTEGVLAALAPYSDDQVAHAVARAATSPAANPVGLLVDRANRQDPAYFPSSPPLPLSVPIRSHGPDCFCEGQGTIPLDSAGQPCGREAAEAFLPCSGIEQPRTPWPRSPMSRDRTPDAAAS